MDQASGDTPAKSEGRRESRRSTKSQELRSKGIVENQRMGVENTVQRTHRGRRLGGAAASPLLQADRCLTLSGLNGGPDASFRLLPLVGAGVATNLLGALVDHCSG